MQSSDLDFLERMIPTLNHAACKTSILRAQELLTSNPQMPSSIRRRWLNVITLGEQRLAALQEKARRRGHPSRQSARLRQVDD